MISRRFRQTAIRTIEGSIVHGHRGDMNDKGSVVDGRSLLARLTCGQRRAGRSGAWSVCCGFEHISAHRWGCFLADAIRLAGRAGAGRGGNVRDWLRWELSRRRIIRQSAEFNGSSLICGSWRTWAAGCVPLAVENGQSMQITKCTPGNN
jgi:hypothetical protein